MNVRVCVLGGAYKREVWREMECMWSVLWVRLTENEKGEENNVVEEEEEEKEKKKRNRKNP
ncbi:hypothetical protein E2C01_070297 [Portunus trituberculatus]|uniref:Uncharacterized protein n=1 Tax=Portunus trituberculatus TaxID=210409 RepID=A0A5B7I4Q9_PORTR|nr:hypothetical protein [Portunus trituberculatus]